jgi:hypothetical protein
MAARGIDYFENSVRASDLQHRYAIENPREFVAYDEDFWGLTACDGPGKTTLPLPDGDSIKVHTYWARGVDGHTIRDDGTIAPTAAGGSFPFTPDESEAALKNFWNTYQPWLVGRYGLRDAFNLNVPPRDDQAEAPGWFDTDYLGIDQGPILLQIENYRTGMVWDLLKSNPHVIRGLRKAGFRGSWLDKQNNENAE